MVHGFGMGKSITEEGEGVRVQRGLFCVTQCMDGPYWEKKVSLRMVILSEVTFGLGEKIVIKYIWLLVDKKNLVRRYI